MVLGALRGEPRTSDLTINRDAAASPWTTAIGDGKD
jgi:hypothetical protein